MTVSPKPGRPGRAGRRREPPRSAAAAAAGGRGDDRSRDEGGKVDGFGIDRRKAVMAIAVAAALGVGAVAVLSRVTDLHQALDALRGADRVWIVGLVGGQLLAYGGYSFGYRVIARACGGPCLSWWTTIRLTVLSLGAYVIATGAGGLAVDFWALTRAGEGVHQAGRRVLAFNILEWAILSAGAALAAAVVLAGGGHSAPVGMALPWLAGVPAAVAAAAWFSSPRRGGRFTRIPVGEEPPDPGWNPGRRARWAWVKVRKGFADAIGGLVLLRMLLGRPIRYRGAPLGFVVYWLGDMLTLYAALRALGTGIGPADLVLAYATGYLVTSAPLPGGASGFSEAATAFALHQVGTPLPIAVTAVILYRFLTFWLPILPALAFAPRARALARILPYAEREPDPPCRLADDAG